MTSSVYQLYANKAKVQWMNEWPGFLSKNRPEGMLFQSIQDGYLYKSAVKLMEDGIFQPLYLLKHDGMHSLA